jgi:hypothetical protein
VFGKKDIFVCLKYLYRELHYGISMYICIISQIGSFSPFYLSPLLPPPHPPASTGGWTQGLCLQSLHQPFFYDGFFEIGSHKLIAWAGFEPGFSWSLPPE